MAFSSYSVHFTHECASEYLKAEISGQYLLAAQILESKLKPLKGSINHYMDFGCGAGKSIVPALGYINPRGMAVGVDISEKMIAIAIQESEKLKRFFPAVELVFKKIEILNNQETIPVENDVMDFVTTSIVLQELDNLSQLSNAIGEIYQVTKNGGLFLAVCVSDKITCEDFMSFTYAPFPENKDRQDNYRKCQGVDINIVWEHDYHWQKETLLDIFQNVGFSILSVEYPLATKEVSPFPKHPDKQWKDELHIPPFIVVYAVKPDWWMRDPHTFR